MSERHHPTGRLRFISRPVRVPLQMYGEGTVQEYRSILQQEWQHDETGLCHWRDVPHDGIEAQKTGPSGGTSL